MTPQQNRPAPASFGRWSHESYLPLSDDHIKQEIRSAFEQSRGFSVLVEPGLLSIYKEDPESTALWEALTAQTEVLITEAAGPDRDTHRRLQNSPRIRTRLLHAQYLLYAAVARASDLPRKAEDESVSGSPAPGHIGLAGRRFVIIKERSGDPCLLYHAPDALVLTHVGLGPRHKETPSIYLGLNLLELVFNSLRRGEDTLFSAFVSLLQMEERAIETGYAHIEPLPDGNEERFNGLIEQLLSYYEISVLEHPPAPTGKIPGFSPTDRQRLVEKLNARQPHDEMNFDYSRNLEGIDDLEKLARLYKEGNDANSLREVVRLLVAASGHDIHEVRNKANLLLERVFAPKEFDAPLAVQFAVQRRGETERYKFLLPQEEQGYVLRIYEDRSRGEFVLDEEIDFYEIPLKTEGGSYYADLSFSKLGCYDYIIRRGGQKEESFVKGESGRITVIPDLRGEVILEIFPDIHGHTRVYWKTEHPGLVYNEHGQVIRLGNFDDVTAHLADLKKRLGITSVYLLGVQKRGRNREDWAAEARSPSPFAPVSLTEIEPALGGPEALKRLVKQAHNLGIKIIVDLIPHLNRRSTELGEEFSVKCYGDDGQLVVRASTDGRYGTWNDGKLLNYRKFELWEYTAASIATLIDEFNIDGVRYDSAHAVPIMMKRNNYPFCWGERRSDESMLEGEIIVNDREYDHFITTGYYDSACHEILAVPFHFFLSQEVYRKLRQKRKHFFAFFAECYWGREQHLSRTGLIPYNSALFKICEQVIKGERDVRELYHLYDNYYPSVLPRGAELLGILGNHDEPRALTVFGSRGARAALMLTSFLSSAVLDYEGGAEGEAWKVFLDNIYVDWNQFENASYRAMELFYRELYTFHKEKAGSPRLIWTENHMVAAAVKETHSGTWIGAFNFSQDSQHVALRFDTPGLPIKDDEFYRLSDPVYSSVTGGEGWYTGFELKASRVHMTIPHTDRVKLLLLTTEPKTKEHKEAVFFTSFSRLPVFEEGDGFRHSYAFNDICAHAESVAQLSGYIKNIVIPVVKSLPVAETALSLKRVLYYLHSGDYLKGDEVDRLLDELEKGGEYYLKEVVDTCRFHHKPGALVFIAAEAEPFSKSGGLANVLYELPVQLAGMGEEVYVITPYYQQGSVGERRRMEQAAENYGITYTGENAVFWVGGRKIEAGIHRGLVDGVHYILLHHHEAFDGLYWGITGREKMFRRGAFARGALEAIRKLNIDPLTIFTNDAYTGPVAPLLRYDRSYAGDLRFVRTSVAHIIHNCGWQYFDAYSRYEEGHDLLELLSIDSSYHYLFLDPQDPGRVNCMAAGIRGADQIVTVSPSYAAQIQVQSDGMEAVLHDVQGISNGVNPNFRLRGIKKVHAAPQWKQTLEDLRGYIRKHKGLMKKLTALGVDYASSSEELPRVMYKLLLQFSRGLTVDPEIPVAVMIHRVTEQKGFQLLLETSEQVVKELGFQLVLGGAVAGGDRRGEELGEGIVRLGEYFPAMVSSSIGFQDVHLPLAGGDVFLMPSLHEPGGISQLEAMVCGCFVVARATGGLKDTVLPLKYDAQKHTVSGNGFLFSDFNRHSFYDAMRRCREFFQNAGTDLIERGRMEMMENPHTWQKPAGEYLHLVYDRREILRRREVHVVD